MSWTPTYAAGTFTQANEDFRDAVDRAQAMVDAALSTWTPLNGSEQENFPALQTRMTQEFDDFLAALGSGVTLKGVYATKSAFNSTLSGLANGLYGVVQDESLNDTASIYSVTSGVATVFHDFGELRAKVGTIDVQSTSIIDGTADASLTLRAMGSDQKTRLYVIPNGAPTGAPAAIKIFADDFEADDVEYRDIGLFHLPPTSVGGTTGPKKLVFGGAVTITGTFVVGETVTGGTSGATGKIVRVGVKTYSDSPTILYVGTVTGAFSAGETVTGGTSSASAVLTSFDANASTWSPNGAAVFNVKTGSGSQFRGYDEDIVFGYNDVTYSAQIAGRIVYWEPSIGSYQQGWIFGPGAMWKGGVGVTANCIAQFERDVLFSNNTGIRWRNAADTANDTYFLLNSSGSMTITVGGTLGLTLNSAGSMTLAGGSIHKYARVAPYAITYASTITPNVSGMGGVMTCTLTGNVAVANPTHSAGDQFELILTADGTNRTVAFGNQYRLPASWSGSVLASKATSFTFRATASGTIICTALTENCATT